MLLSDKVSLMAKAMPWALPGLAVSLMLAVVISGPAARWLRCGRVAAIATVFCWLAVVAVVDTPTSAALRANTGVLRFCSFQPSGLVSGHDLASLTDRGLNVALLVPVGMAIAWLGRRGAVINLSVGVALPIVVEATQFAAAGLLGRSCQLTDVEDGYTGLVAGAIVGLAVLFARYRTRMARRRRAASSQAMRPSTIR